MDSRFNQEDSETTRMLNGARSALLQTEYGEGLVRELERILVAYLEDDVRRRSVREVTRDLRFPLMTRIASEKGITDQVVIRKMTVFARSYCIEWLEMKQDQIKKVETVNDGAEEEVGRRVIQVRWRYLIILAIVVPEAVAALAHSCSNEDNNKPVATEVCSGSGRKVNGDLCGSEVVDAGVHSGPNCVGMEGISEEARALLCGK